MTKITFRKDPFRWLFGGFGFHNSEATMTSLMTEEFLNQRVLKSFYEISPTFSRLFAGYANWTKEAMDEFADYYFKTFAKADTTLYAVPGRMPLHETLEEMEEYVEKVVKNLNYLVNEKGLKLWRYYCISNELSVGNEYAMMGNDLEKFKTYHHMLWKAFRRYDLDMELMATDCSGTNKFHQIEWAAQNMDQYTAVYCAHNYETNNMAWNDPEFYTHLYNIYSDVVKVARKREKRFLLGEFGLHNDEFSASPYMYNDVPAGYGNQTEEEEYAIMACVENLAALNSGCLGAIFWTFCDYPDPFLNWWGSSKEAQARYNVGRFSGHGTAIRYNKHGMFRWTEEGDYSARPALYSVGLMAKFFRANSRILNFNCDNKSIICGGVTNFDQSMSLCLINLQDKKDKVSLDFEFPVKKAFRRYDFVRGNVAYNEFNDLQGFTVAEPSAKDRFDIPMEPYSMVILTTDYEDRKPSAVKDIAVTKGGIRWSASADSEHCYYRVYENGNQIASTAATKLKHQVNSKAKYTVKSVDKYGNV